MVIANAIREAETEYVVYFLLETYLKTESRRVALKNLPARISLLPLTGRQDAQTRCAMLMYEFDAASRRVDAAASAGIAEALTVFSAAVQRLESLNSKKSGSRAAGARPFFHAAAAPFPKASTQA